MRVAPGRTLPQELARTPGARHLFGNWWRLPLATDENLGAFRQRSATRPEIELVEADVVQRLAFGTTELTATSQKSAPIAPPLVANDPLFAQQWHHRRVGAEAAWLRSTGSGVVVAVIDIGVSIATTAGSDGFCHPLAGEYDARKAYKSSRELCESLGDYVTKNLFEELLTDEEGHIDFLETQLDLLGKIGEQN